MNEWMEILAAVEEDINRKPFRMPTSTVVEDQQQLDGTRQALMVQAHSLHQTIINNGQTTGRQMLDMADKLEKWAAYLREMASDVDYKNKQAAEVTTEALKHERKAYAEFFSFAKALEEQGAGRAG